MVINLLRLLLGFVEFEARGGFFERFVNLCTMNGVTLWNVHNDGVKVKACTTMGGYKNIRKSARNSGMKVKILRKRGFPFFIRKNKVRAGFLIGLFITVFFLALSSCMLWNIEVSGNNEISGEVLTESLEKHGVKIGAIKSKIDTTVIEKELLKEYPELSWASINIFGTKAVLEVKENVTKPDILDIKTPANIIAEKDGQILLVEGHNGTNVVKEGDVVRKGDLLISGVNINGDGSEKMVHASGKVYASTVTNLSSGVSEKGSSQMLENVDIKYYVFFLGFDIPAFFKSKGEKLYSDTICLKSNDTALPFGISWSVFGELRENDITLTENQTKLIALLRCVENKRQSFSEDYEITEIIYTLDSGKGESVVNCHVKAKENIATEKELLVE